MAGRLPRDRDAGRGSPFHRPPPLPHSASFIDRAGAWSLGLSSLALLHLRHSAHTLRPGASLPHNLPRSPARLVLIYLRHSALTHAHRLCYIAITALGFGSMPALTEIGRPGEPLLIGGARLLG